MYYEINVSLNGAHFFATAERSITSENKLKRVHDALKAAFPESDGYEISVTKWVNSGENINMNVQDPEGILDGNETSAGV